MHEDGDHRPGDDSPRGRAAARGRGSPRPDLAPGDRQRSTSGVGARARGALDEALRGAYRGAHLLRFGAHFRLRARQTGPRRCLLQHDGRTHRSTPRAAAVGGKVVKFREIFRFEFMCQARRVRTWLYFAVLFVAAYLIVRISIVDARNGDAFINSPYVIALTTVISSLLWVVMASAVAGSAAARDVQTRMHPLIYTTPVSKTDYLCGRLLAALAFNALILLAVPAGMLVAQLSPGVESEILGPFRPAAYLSAYVLIALPTVFVVTSIQFSLAAMSGRSAASYLGSLLLFPVIGFIVAGAVA